MGRCFTDDDDIHPAEEAYQNFRTQLARAAKAIAGDYPNIENVEPLEQLYAMVSSYRGLESAAKDCHTVISRLARMAGLSADQLDQVWQDVMNNEGTSIHVRSK